MAKFFFSILLVSFLFSCKEESQVIETLDGHKVTVEEFRTAYDTYVDFISRSQNIEKKTLLEFIDKTEAEIPQQFLDLYFSLQKRNFYNNYRQTLMTKIVADKKGFSSRPEVQSQMKFQEMQMVSQLFLQEEVEKKIKITQEQVEAECERLRKSEKNIDKIDIEKCLNFARANLRSQKTREEIPQLIERIKEEVSIRRNENFDLDAYLLPKKPSGEGEPKNEPTAKPGP